MSATELSSRELFNWEEMLNAIMHHESPDELVIKLTKLYDFVHGLSEAPYGNRPGF